MPEKKPKCKLLGEDGNIFAIVGRASAALRKSGLKEQSKEMQRRVLASHSYADAVSIVLEYVEAK